MAHPLAPDQPWTEERLVEALKPRESGPGVDGLYSLALQGQWRQVIARCQEVQPSSPAASLTVSTFHILGLARLGLYPAALDQLAHLGDLDKSPAPAPYALRWLAAEVPGMAGNWKAAAAGFHSLLELCYRECERATHNAVHHSKWAGRRAQVAAALAAVLARQQHYPSALGVLDTELARGGRNPETWLHAAAIQLRIGDIGGAEASISSAAYLIEDTAGSSPSAPFAELDPLRWRGGKEGDHSRRLIRVVRLFRGLLAVCRQDWGAATIAFQAGAGSCAEAAGNLALCRLYANNVDGAIQELEMAFHEQPIQMLQGPFICNLMALLDLTCPNASAKRRFTSWVESIAPDELDVETLGRRIPPQPALSRT